jgi:hypothetical protein
VWLERKLFGLPSDHFSALDLSDTMSKGYRHAALRNALIKDQNMPWNSIYGNMDEWSWWRSLPKDTPQPLCDAIEMGLDACCTMIPEPGTALGDQYKDPVSAIAGLLAQSDMRDFLAADLKTIRKSWNPHGSRAGDHCGPRLGNPGCLHPRHGPLLCNENRTGSVR